MHDISKTNFMKILNYYNTKIVNSTLIILNFEIIDSLALIYIHELNITFLLESKQYCNI